MTETKSLYAPGDCYGDAKVVTTFSDPDPALAQQMTISLGANKESQKWKPATMPIGAFMAKLARHEVGNKDGASYVLGDMVPGRRLKTAVKALYAVGLDVDVGTSTAQIDAALKKLGCMAIRYSTHSHLKSTTEFKRDRLTKWAEKEANGDDFEQDEVLQRFLLEAEHWDPEIIATAHYVRDDHQDRGIMAIVEHRAMPKHRIVLPFAEPFVISEQTGTQADAMKKWGKVPTALALDLGVPLDESCLDPSRLFYFPRHAKGKPFDASIFGGPLFDWTSLVLDDPFEAEIAKLTKGTSKSQTAEGRDLGRWSMKRAHGFQIVQALEGNCPDKLRNQTGSGWEIECPFDEEHSNPGDPDDRACMAVNAGDGPSEWFSVRCLHETCKSKTNLDMVGKMVADGWFAREALDDETYNAVVDGEVAPSPLPRILAEIGALDPSDPAGRDAIVRQLGNMTSDGDREIAIARLKDRTKIKISILRQEVKACSGSLAGTTAPRVIDVDGHSIFRHEGEGPDQVDARAFLIETLNRANRTEPVFSLNLGSIMHLTRSSGAVEFHELSLQEFRAELGKRCSFARISDNGGIGPRRLPDLDLCSAVFNGMEAGELPAQPVVRRAPTIGRNGQLMDRDGWYGDVFVDLGGLQVPPIPDTPTFQDADDAVWLLTTELLGDFPFYDGIDEAGVRISAPSMANSLSMFLTSYMRDLFDGPAPLFGIDKPQAGVGGTLLAQLSSLLFEGREAVSISFTRNEEELQKALVTEAREGGSHILFDNVRELESEVLKRSITASRIGGRLLGVNAKVERTNHFVWQFTGNNVPLGEEMARRTVPINLNALMDEPSRRQFKARKGRDGRDIEFKAWVMENRGRLIGALLTIIRFWIVEDKPLGRAKFDSFESWARAVGGVLQACGGEAFLQNLRRSGHDRQGAEVRDFINQWFGRSGESAVEERQLFDNATTWSPVLITGFGEAEQRRNFGRFLDGLVGRTYTFGVGTRTVTRVEEGWTFRAPPKRPGQ